MEATTAEALTGWGTIGAAIGTVGTLLAALGQLNTERKERQKSEELRRKREHREQADAVSAWYARTPDAGDSIEMANRSDQPVYDVVVSLAYVQGAVPRNTEGWVAMGDLRYVSVLVALPPGRFRVLIEDAWRGMSSRPGAEIAFTDRHGTTWVRRVNGNLEELPTNAMDSFGLLRPFEYVPPIDAWSA